MPTREDGQSSISIPLGVAPITSPHAGPTSIFRLRESPAAVLKVLPKDPRSLHRNPLPRLPSDETDILDTNHNITTQVSLDINTIQFKWNRAL